MKNKYFLNELTVSLILIILLVLLLNPFGFWMPTTLLMILILGLLIVFTAFGILIWKEKVKDERQNFHLMLAGRTAFLTGAAVLIIGIITQSLSHTLDTWLILALGIMILAYISTLIYCRNKY